MLSGLPVPVFMARRPIGGTGLSILRDWDGSCEKKGPSCECFFFAAGPVKNPRLGDVFLPLQKGELVRSCSIWHWYALVCSWRFVRPLGAGARKKRITDMWESNVVDKNSRLRLLWTKFARACTHPSRAVFLCRLQVVKLTMAKNGLTYIT